MRGRRSVTIREIQANLDRATPASLPPIARNQAIDIYRGLVMLLMMAEVLRLGAVAKSYPGNPVWQFLGYHQSHVEWVGCSIHDLIQPSFSFLVGVALPFSLAGRMRRGERFGQMFRHGVIRAFLLIALGIFLRSTSSAQTNYTFEDTLTQIGLGYPFLFLLGFARPRVQIAALAAILTSYWLAWAWYPADLQFGDWAHWSKGSNLGAAFDRWFLNLFPRPKPFIANGGGYVTLSFIPTLGTMLLGLLAGRWLRENDAASLAKPRITKLCLAGAAAIVAGLLLHFAGICPIVKRIWTPSWSLFSGGICFLLLAGLTVALQNRTVERIGFPLIVIGTNSMAAYLLAHLAEQFFESTIRIHFHPALWGGPDEPWSPAALGAWVLLGYWLVLLAMYRRKIFLKI